MDQDYSTVGDRTEVDSDTGSEPGGQVLDHVSEHIRRWEATLANVNADGFYIPLHHDRFGRHGMAEHFVVFDEYEGERRLIEVELRDHPHGFHVERLVIDAPRTIRVEVLRRLPKAFEGVLIRRKHGTG